MSGFARVAAVVAAFPIAYGALPAQQVVDLPAGDRALQPRLEEVYRVGRLEGAAWELYGGRVETAFDGVGNLHVFDPENHRVVVVSPEGAFLREVGKRGEGPGELRSPAAFAVMRDGTVAIADMGHRAFLVFDARGEFQRSVRFGSEALVMLGRVLADPRGGSVLSAGRQFVMMTAAGPGGPPPMPAGRPIVRYPLDGGASQEVHSAWEPPPPDATPAAGRGGAIRMRPLAQAFEPELFAGVLPDGGVALSDSSAWAVKIVGPEGGVRRVLRRPIRPQPVTARMEADERARRLAELEEGGGPRIQVQMGGRGGGVQPVPQGEIQAMLRRSIEQLEFYPELPVVTGLAVGWTGKIWVGRRGPTPQASGPVDVLTPDGEYLGTFAAGGPRVPSAFGPDGLAAYVERDELDVASVAVRRLPAELR